jgi:AraC family transcriptional regulator
VSASEHISYADWIMGEAALPLFKEHQRIGDASGSLFRLELEEAFPDPPTSDVTIQMVTKGGLHAGWDFGVGRQSGRMRGGDFTVAPANVPLHIEGRGRSEFLILAIPEVHVRGLVLEATGSEADAFGRLHARASRDQQTATLMSWLWQEAETGRPAGKLFADAALAMIVGRLLALNGRQHLPTKGGLAPWQVRRVTEYLRDHLEEDVTLEQLGGLVGLSPHHLCRAFKQSTGESPHAWFARRRIERAQEIIEGDLTVGFTQVALCVGYASQSAFGTAFRRVTGTTPSAWRRERIR